MFEALLRVVVTNCTPSVEWPREPDIVPAVRRGYANACDLSVLQGTTGGQPVVYGCCGVVDGDAPR